MQCVLVDDHEGIRQELRRILQEYPGVEVVAEAADGVEALAVTEKLKPDLDHRYSYAPLEWA